jgi:hypothetical protein
LVKLPSEKELKDAEMRVGSGWYRGLESGGLRRAATAMAGLDPGKGREAFAGVGGDAGAVAGPDAILE